MTNNGLIDRKTLQLHVGLKLRLPTLPNFLRGTDDTPYDISAFDEAQLTEIGARWTEALIEKAKAREP